MSHPYQHMTWLLSNGLKKKTSCWAYGSQDTNMTKQIGNRSQYIRKLKASKPSPYVKVRRKSEALQHPESMSFAPPVWFFLSSSFYFQQPALIPSALKHDSSVVSPAGSRKDQKLKEQLTFTASGCHKFSLAGRSMCHVDRCTLSWDQAFELDSPTGKRDNMRSGGTWQLWRMCWTFASSAFVQHFCCYKLTSFSKSQSSLLKEGRWWNLLEKIKVPTLFLWTRWSPRALRINGWRHKSFELTWAGVGNVWGVFGGVKTKKGHLRVLKYGNCNESDACFVHSVGSVAS